MSIPPAVRGLPIYVVTVKTFVDRHRHMRNYEAKYGLTFEYIWDFDADALPADLAGVSPNLSAKSASNCLKHIEVQRRMVARGQNRALVFEDDVVLFPGFFDRLAAILERASQLEPGWLIFLAGADNRIDARFEVAAPEALIEKPISTAEAYLLDLDGCERRLAWLEKGMIDRQADNQIRLIDAALGIPHFWPPKPLATQGSINGKFATSLDEGRARYSPTLLRIRYGFNVLKRQWIPRMLWRLKKWGVRG